MSRRVLRLSLLVFAVALAAVPAGCGRKPAPADDDKPLPVAWSYPVQRQVVDHVDFTGRLDSPNAVDIKPRVTGYIIKTPFKEGTEIKQDDILFEIDPRTYKATVDQSVADVNLAAAKYDLAKADNARAKKIKADNPAAISQQDLDKYDAGEKEALAAVEADKAKVETARIYHAWCKVQSPIDGLISRYYMTTGNLVNQDQSLLTTLVALDPMYCYFDMDERTLLRLRQAILDGRLKVKRSPREIAVLCVSSLGQIACPPNPWSLAWSARSACFTEDFTVFIGLANETGFPHKGTVNFFNNKVDPLTGTITVRGVFDNPKGAEGVRLMSPGMFARVHLPISPPYRALLVSQKVILTDQGLKNVYVIDAEDKVQYRAVELGTVQPDGLQVIVKGLLPTDRVAISNLQFIRPGMVVAPEEKAMPVEKK